MAKTVNRARALQEAAISIVSELSMDVVLQKIVDVAKNLVGARYAALGVARADRKGLTRFIVSGVTDGQIKAIGEWPRGLGLLGELLRNPRPLRVHNIHEHPSSIGFPPGHPEMTSFLGVPVASKGRILGNFYLTDKIGAKEFGQDDEDLVVALAAFAAVAIDNARLYAETETQLRRRVEDLERAETRSRFLVELSALLPIGPLTEDLPLYDVLTGATGLLGDACGVFLVNPDGSVAGKEMVHRDPARAKAAEEFIEDSWAFIRHQVVTKGNYMFVADVNAVLIPPPALEVGKMRGGKFSATMALPIKSAKRVYGVFISLASQPLTFAHEDLVFGQLVAQRLGTAMENSELLRQLKDALKTRDEFISIATHELKTPVAVLVGYADLAMKSLGATPQQLRPILETIKRQSSRLAQLANELLDVSRIRAGRLELARERLNLSALVTEAVHRHESQLGPEDKRRLKLIVSATDLWGEWDPLRMEQVLVNLLSNAFKYSPNGGMWRLE